MTGPVGKCRMNMDWATTRHGLEPYVFILSTVRKPLNKAKQDGNRITITSTGLIFTSSYGVQRLRPPGRDHNAH